MALVLPILLLLVVGIVDFGFMFRELSVVTNAAREGARAGVLPGYDDDANVVARVQQYLDASGISVTCTTGGSGDCQVAAPVVDVTTPAGTFEARDVSVTTFHTFSFLSPIASLVGGSFGTVPLTGRAVMRVEVGAAAP